ncbi:MAG: serine/threonine protein kinase, partial [Myxococcales bacterium]|nr:serine/threonine protein kinase [Myxococcales bacterium]
VHRDFKPDNVLVGHDGRVRVTDFGLARVLTEAEVQPAMPDSHEATLWASQLTRTGALLGTPAYMAPEQLRGGEADAKSDQFGFCIALYEALYGERPFAGSTLAELEQAISRGEVRPLSKKSGPAWLRRVVLRGLQAEPAQRWPSMDALLSALGREPIAWRLRLMAAALALLLAVSAVAVARVPARSSSCPDASAKLVGVWDQGQRQRVQRAFFSTGVAYAEAAFRSVSQALDAYAQAWLRMHAEACEATHVRGEQSTALLDLRMHCLEKQRQALQALAALYAQADAELIERAARIVPTVSTLRSCSDARELMQPTPLPADPSLRARIAAIEQRLATVRAEHQAGHYQTALRAATAVTAEASALAHAPLAAEAHLLLGEIQQTLGEHRAAEASLYQALWAGEAGKQDRIAAKAWIGLVYVVGYSMERPDESQRLVQHAEAALRRLGGDELERANLESAIGSIDFAQGRYGQARLRFDASRSLIEKTLGAESPELVLVLQRLALVLEPLGVWAEAIALERRALAILETQVGAEHPQTADSRRRLAQHLFYNEYFEDALSMAQHALTTCQRNYAGDDDHVASALLGVSEILLDMQRGAEALPLATRALAIRRQHRDAWHTELAEALAQHGQALLQVGQTQQALSEALRVKEIVTRTLGTGHVKYAWAMADLGRVYAARGELRRAYDAHREGLRALSHSQVTDVWSVEKQRVEVGRAELALRDGRAAVATLSLAVANLERDDSIAILLGDAYLRLAEARALVGQRDARTQHLAQQALVIFRRQPIGRARRIAEVERFLAHAFAAAPATVSRQAR